MKGLCAVFIIVTVLIFTTPLIAIEFEYSRKPVTSDDLAVSAVFESLLRVYGKGADQVVPYLEEKVVYWTTSGGGYGFQPKEEGERCNGGIGICNKNHQCVGPAGEIMTHPQVVTVTEKNEKCGG